MDYREKMSAAGRFPGGFFKREGRPTTKEILTCRMIDRPLRPLFPEGFNDEIQIQVMVLAADPENDPDVIGMVSAAAAVALSGAPISHLIAAVRVGRIDGKFVINPSRAQIEYSDMDMILAGHRQAVNMIEVGSRELPEDVIADAVKFGHTHGILPICEMIEELRRQAGRECKWEPSEADVAFYDEVKGKVWDDLAAAKSIVGKAERQAAVRAVYDRIIAEYCPEDVDKPERTPGEVKATLDKIEGRLVRDRILNDKTRSDQRKLDEIRTILCDVGWLPRVHGSSLFSRGETQAMVTCTLGTSRDEQIIDDLIEEYSKKFLLHYNFPPFSVGEARRIMGRPPRNRHVALAERAWRPSSRRRDFPYTIRLLRYLGVERLQFACQRLRRHLGLMDAASRLARPSQEFRSAWSKKAIVTCSWPTFSARKTTTATWTSRWPERVKALLACS